MTAVSVVLCPILNGQQFFDNSGLPLAGGLIGAYIAGSSSVTQDTYTSSAGTVLNSNPIVLDSSGRITTSIWLQFGKAYNLVLKNSLGTVIQSWDNITGSSASSSGGSTVADLQWVAGAAPTFVSVNSFFVTGNSTSTYNAGRRVKAVSSSATTFGTVLSATFSGGVTTVALSMDAGTLLDSGLASVFYGINSGTNTSVPAGFGNTSISLASAGTITIGTSPSQNIDITGGGTITSFGNAAEGIIRFVTFDTLSTLTYNATSMVTPNAVDLIVGAGDTIGLKSLGSSNWQVIFAPFRIGLAATPAATTTLVGSAASFLMGEVDVSGAATITAFDAAPLSAIRIVQFDGICTLVHSSPGLALFGGNNITTAAGDKALFVSGGSGHWELLFYQVGAAQYVTSSGAAATGVGSTGQTWKQVPLGANPTTQRQNGSTYTNSTGKPIQVSIAVDMNSGAGTSGDVTIFVDGVAVTYSAFYYSDHYMTSSRTDTVIVPAGSTYRCLTTSNFQIRFWAELS